MCIVNQNKMLLFHDVTSENEANVEWLVNGYRKGGRWGMAEKHIRVIEWLRKIF
jgi:hypothetical protein